MEGRQGLEDFRRGLRGCGRIQLSLGEMVQARLYQMETGGLPPWLHYLRASVGDGLVVLVILVAGAGILGGLDWFRRPGAAGYAWMLVSGLVIAIAIEWTSVHILKRWSQTGDASPARPGDWAPSRRSDAGSATRDFRHCCPAYA
jgi:hypothetical protein